MKKVYEIQQDLVQLEQYLEENPDMEEVVKDTIESLEGEFEEKINNILLAVKNYEKEAEAFKAESDRLKELAQSSEKQAKRLLEYADYACKLMGKTKFTTSHFKVSYRKGSEVVDISPDAEIPLEFTRVKTEPMKTELKKYLKEGNEVPGITLVRKPDSLVVK
jgi:uncharacterized protein YeeX (DUF496 family)